MKIGSPTLTTSIRSCQASSLVEVTLALGLMSFAILPLMGLMAMGFTHYRSAGEMNVEAVIIQQIRSLSVGITTANQVLGDAYFTIDGTVTQANDPDAMYKVTSAGAVPAKINQSPSETLANRFEITHLHGGEITFSGVVHITPR